MANAADHSPMGEEAETDTPSGCSSSTPSSTPTTTPTPELFHPRVPPPDRNGGLSSRNLYTTYWRVMLWIRDPVPF